MRRFGFFACLAAILGIIGVPVGFAQVANVEDPVLVGAGDIAVCTRLNDEATANLLDTIPGTIFTAGDNVYPDGSDTDFANCYEPSWGRHKSRTRPSPGNHDYHIADAAGYFRYFGAAAGEIGKGYYSYDLGAWHIIAINSNCAAIGGCHAGSPQEQWLRADLAAHPTDCTLAYWHHPLFSSGRHGGDADMRAIWQALYDAGADVVLNGHDHNYERFAPQDPLGRADPARGIREFVVGTGGANLRAFVTIAANSEVRNADTHGVLKLTLHATSYDWQFIPVAGKSFTDTGNAQCSSLTSPPPTATPTVPSGNILKNPGFEFDVNGDTRPDSWSSSTRFTRDSVSVHEGSYSGRHFATDNSSYTIKQKVANLSAGTTYTFSGWVNIPATSDAFSFRLDVRWRNASNATISTSVIATLPDDTNGSWSQAQQSLVAPAGTTNALVRMVVKSLNGTIYVDEFFFGTL